MLRSNPKHKLTRIYWPENADKNLDAIALDDGQTRPLYALGGWHVYGY
jgi:hypothetical protein